MKRLTTLLGIAVLASSTTVAQEGTSLESDWIELVKGHKGEAIGVELRDIQEQDGEGARTVTLAVPKASMSHPDTIEEVLVVARAPEAPEAPQPIKVQYQWLDNYDEDNYGLVIKLGEGNWPIRLYLNSSPGYVREAQTP